MFDKEESAWKQQEAVRKKKEKEVSMMSPRRSPRRSSGSNVTSTDVSQSKGFAASYWTTDESDDEITDSVTSLARASIPTRRDKSDAQEMYDGNFTLDMTGRNSSTLAAPQGFSDLGQGYRLFEDRPRVSSLSPIRAGPSSLAGGRNHEGGMGPEQSSLEHAMYISPVGINNRRHTDAGTHGQGYRTHTTTGVSRNSLSGLRGATLTDAPLQPFTSSLSIHPRGNSDPAGKPSVSFQGLEANPKMISDDGEYAQPRVGETIGEVRIPFLPVYVQYRSVH